MRLVAGSCRAATEALVFLRPAAISLIEIMNRRKFLTSAAAAPAIAAAQSADNFTPLFDGRTLAGWSIRQGPESAFYVRDGAIVVHHGAGFPCWLRSAAQYENFDFAASFSSTAGSIPAFTSTLPNTAETRGRESR